jgi:hypothetical protein
MIFLSVLDASGQPVSSRDLTLLWLYAFSSSALGGPLPPVRGCSLREPHDAEAILKPCSGCARCSMIIHDLSSRYLSSRPRAIRSGVHSRSSMLVRHVGRFMTRPFWCTRIWDASRACDRPPRWWRMLISTFWPIGVLERCSTSFPHRRGIDMDRRFPRGDRVAHPAGTQCGLSVEKEACRDFTAPSRTAVQLCLFLILR